MGGRWAVLAVWAALPGCVVSVGDKPAAPPAPVVGPVEAPPPRDFAVMRSLKPGEFQPDHPILAAALPPKPADPPPIPPPTLTPPTTHVAASVPTDSPVVATVRHLEADRWADAEAAGLPPGVLLLLETAVRAARGGPTATGEALRQLDQAAAALAPQAPLAVSKAVFCKEVKGFGLYTPLPTDKPTFTAGQKKTVFVYLELRNVAPRLEGDRYVWQPKATWVVRDAAGVVVDQRAEVPPREPVRTPTRENFVGVYFAAPERPGSYTVTVGVAEPAADGRGVSREVSKVLSFVVK